MHRSSFSQHNSFNTCPRMWFYAKILKIQVPSDMCYAFAGNVIHKCLELYYSKEITDLDKLKERFNEEWDRKRLPQSKIALKKDEYFLMIVNGIELNKKFTSIELKIYYPDCVGYIDAVNTEDDEICDWKSSTRRIENEEEYTKQLMLYAWLYYRKFNRLPKKCTVYYLKYSGSKSELSIVPTVHEVNNIRVWYNDILQQMEELKETKKLPERCETCHPFCDYKEICFTNENTLKFIIHRFGNYIRVEGNITPLLSKGLDKKFSYTLKDEYFILKHNPHARTVIKYWSPIRKQLPIGMEKGVAKTLNDYAKFKKMDITIGYKDYRNFDDTVVDMPTNFLNNIKLRDYQTSAVEEFLENKIAILEMGTGSGKTEVSIEIIRQLKSKTLFIVDKVELLKQTKKRIEDSLGIEVGQFGAGVKELKNVTVATIQTLMKLLSPMTRLRQAGITFRDDGYAEKKDIFNREYLQLVAYLRTIRLAIFDECHHVSSKSYVKLAKELTGSEYRLGLSATAFRDDGNDMAIQTVVGDKCVNLSSKVLVEKGWLINPKIRFIKNYIIKENLEDIERECKKGLINETPQYSNYYDGFITKCNERNNIINEIVGNTDKQILILVKFIKHGEILQTLISGSKYLKGSTNKKERDEMLNEFKSGKLKVLIATISIFSEGIDLPFLEIIINASANRGNVKTIQTLGRVLRILEGKKNATYIDFYDNMNFFNVASRSRMRILKQEGHEVEIIDSNNIKELF